MAILIFIHIHVPSSYEFCNCPFLKRLHYKLDKQMAFHQYESWYASSCHYHISLAWDKKDKPICLDQCKLGLGDSEKMIKCEWMILKSSTMLICEINEISRNSNKQREICKLMIIFALIPMLAGFILYCKWPMYTETF